MKRVDIWMSCDRMAASYLMMPVVLAFLSIGTASASSESLIHNQMALAPGNTTNGEACVASTGRWGGGKPSDGERFTSGGEDIMLVGAGAELLVFDISMPTLPVELGRVLINHPALNVAVSENGQLAAVSDSFDNVTIIDIMIEAPDVQRQLPGRDSSNRGLEFRGDHLYVAVRTVGLQRCWISSDPDTPAFVAKLRRYGD